MKEYTAKNLEKVIKMIQGKRKATGTFFSATNTTAKGIRKWVCRFGVVKHLRGGERAYNFHNKNLICVWDTYARDYRCITIDTITDLKVCGHVLIKNGVKSKFLKNMLKIANFANKLND
jgi:hypothetical protein